VAVGQLPVAVLGGPRDEEENAYAAALLAKFLIVIGRAQWRVVPMVCYCYLGFVIVLLLLGGGWGKRESNKI
jgi:hypothetical protein